MAITNEDEDFISDGLWIPLNFWVIHEFGRKQCSKISGLHCLIAAYSHHYRIGTKSQVRVELVSYKLKHDQR